MAELKILIVDDEPEACDMLTNIFTGFQQVTIEGIAHSTAEAEHLIDILNPSVVFLDIEMPEENAFQFLQRISPFSFEVVFVTAYDEYAVKAFRLNAIDYILKPVDEEEIVQSLEKLRAKLDYKRSADHRNSLYASLPASFIDKEPQRQIILRNNNHYEVVSFSNIQYVEAMGRYSNIFYTKDGIMKNILMAHSIAEYEELLPAELFYRIHRSFLVNGAKVKQIFNTPGEHFIMIDGQHQQLPVSRRRYPEFLDFLKGYNFYER